MKIFHLLQFNKKWRFEYFWQFIFSSVFQITRLQLFELMNTFLIFQCFFCSRWCSISAFMAQFEPSETERARSKHESSKRKVFRSRIPRPVPKTCLCTGSLHLRGEKTLRMTTNNNYLQNNDISSTTLDKNFQTNGLYQKNYFYSDNASDKWSTKSTRCDVSRVINILTNFKVRPSLELAKDFLTRQFKFWFSRFKHCKFLFCSLKSFPSKLKKNLPGVTTFLLRVCAKIERSCANQVTFSWSVRPGLAFPTDREFFHSPSYFPSSSTTILMATHSVPSPAVHHKSYGYARWEKFPKLPFGRTFLVSWRLLFSYSAVNCFLVFIFTSFRTCWRKFMFNFCIVYWRKNNTFTLGRISVNCSYRY